MNLTLWLDDLIFLLVGVLLLVLINSAFIREISVWLKLKDTSFLTSIDYSLIFIVMLLVWSLIPSPAKILWALFTLGIMFYAMMKYYKLSWKEALKPYSIWLVFIILIGLFISKLAGA